MSSAVKFYYTDEYARRNPSLHEEDSPWKIRWIMPLVALFVKLNISQSVRVLDVGGGAGIILKVISEKLRKDYRVSVTKYVLDLSPLMLARQKQTNPDIQAFYNVDLCENGLDTKFFDLVLMVDVVEHVQDSDKALNEVGRIGKFAVFNIPLEKNVVEFLWNIISHGALRRRRIASVGHLHIYTYSSALKQIKKRCGDPVDYYFTDPKPWPFDFKNRIRDLLVVRIFKLSPKISTLLFGASSLMVLVKCRKTNAEPA
ncbi:MAG: class I SAM-dependent methyltransferase [Candidatus Bathyarchaeia archaeon]|jgi:ubiquinone/menaquinone biosynthesis C-methylase UbiE